MRWSPQFTRFYEAASIFWDLISSSPLFYDNCKLPGTVPCPGFATKVMVGPGLRRRRRCGGAQASFNTSDGVEFAGLAGLP